MTVIVNHLSKCYGKQKALNDVSFTLHTGEICGFLGPNGAGKSTLMKIVTGYLGDYEGNITVDGLGLRQNPLKIKAITGYLPEHNPLYPEMYIREYLLHVARLYHTPEARKRVDEIMELTGLHPEGHKKIGRLSKGYRQRTGLAQALIHDPAVLILDEPMTGLDPNQLEEIRNLILRIGKNKTVLLSTHIMQEVEAICDRIMILDKGSLVADKPKSEFHGNATTEGMILNVSFAANIDSEYLKAIPEIVSIEEVSPLKWRITARPGTDPRIPVFRTAAYHDWPIIELREVEHPLEEIFKSLTNGKNSLRP